MGQLRMMPRARTQKLPTMWRKMGLNADKRHQGDSRMVVGLRRKTSSPARTHLSISPWAFSWFHREGRLWNFSKVNKKTGVIWLKKKKKQDKERTGTRSDRQREKENKGAGERRGAAWRLARWGGP